jgi:hypothetical protein
VRRRRRGSMPRVFAKCCQRFASKIRKNLDRLTGISWKSHYRPAAWLQAAGLPANSAFFDDLPPSPGSTTASDQEEHEAQQAHLRVMETDAKRKYLAAALRDPEIRHACLLVDRIITAGDMLDHMSPTALEVVRDYCTEQARGMTGTSGEFRRAWIELVVDHLNDARTLERRLCNGITGRGVPSLDEHKLPPSSKDTPTREDENGNDEDPSGNPSLLREHT